jgi:MFS transporter, CP family, cyanate transporter
MDQVTDHVTEKDSESQQERVRHTWLAIALCWLVAVNLRTVLLGVPPVLTRIQHDLLLTNTELGLITAIPTLCMGLLAYPSASLIGRIGGRLVVTLGMALVMAGAALRAIPAGPAPLYAFTLVLSVGITVSQTAMPILVRQWFPAHVGLASTIYSNGLIIGEIVAVAVTGPVLLHLLGADAWRGTFIVWGAVAAVALVVWLWRAPASPPLGFAARPAAHTAGDRQGHSAGPRPWLRGTHLGFLLGSGSLIYFGMNAWIPSFDQAMGRPGGTAAALAVLNAAQLPVSLTVALVARRVAGRCWPFVFAGGVVLLGLAGWIWAPAATALIWVALLGGGSSAVFILGTALPSLMGGREDVARLTGVTLGLGYTVAFVGPFLGGALLDLTHTPAMAFAPVAAAGCVILALGSTLPTPAALGLHAPQPAR